MGSIGASFHVQRSNVKVLGNLYGDGAGVYIDDTPIHAVTLERFVEIIRIVVKKFADAKLYCKSSKCVIGVKSLKLLGHIIDGNGIRMADDRREEVARLKFPDNPKKLRAALGETNYQRAFIPEYALITQPLNKLVNGTTAEMNTEEARTAWKQLMRAIADQMSLFHLDYNQQIRVRVDASIRGVACCLFNVGVDANGERWDRLVAVCSHAFTKTEMHWKTIEQECFAMIFGCKYWFPLLWGTMFVIDGDHKNLSYIHQGSSSKVVRWGLFLQTLSYAYNAIDGISNVFPDVLSRQDFNNEGTTIPDLNDFDVQNDIATVEVVQKPPLLSRPMVKGKRKKKSLTEPPGVSNSSDLALRDHRELRVIEDPKERIAIFREVHNGLAGHHGINRTVWMLHDRGVTWVNMAKDIAQFVSECVTCTKNQVRIPEVQVARGTLRQYALFEELSIDFIGPLPTDQLGNSFVCGIICGFSRFTELFATEAQTAVIAAHCVLSVAARYGAPQRIRSDRGTPFVNEVIKELMRMLNIVHVVTPPYRPQANAMQERNGGETVRHLKALVRLPETKDLWSVVLPLVSRIMNRLYRWYLGCCPNDLVYLVPPSVDRGLFEPFRPYEEVLPVTTAFMNELRTAYEAMLDATSQLVYAEQLKFEEQAGTVNITEFNPDDLVLMKYPTQAPSKLHDRLAGPYRVLRREGNLVYIQDLTCERVLERDVGSLIPFRKPKDLQEQDLVAIAAQDLGETVVLDILNHRGDPRKRTTLEFQVQWSDQDVSWESWDTVKKLELLDGYIRSTSDTTLKKLLPKDQKGLAARLTLEGV